MIYFFNKNIITSHLNQKNMLMALLRGFEIMSGLKVIFFKSCLVWSECFTRVYVNDV